MKCSEFCKRSERDSESVFIGFPPTPVSIAMMPTRGKRLDLIAVVRGFAFQVLFGRYFTTKSLWLGDT